MCSAHQGSLWLWKWSSTSKTGPDKGKAANRTNVFRPLMPGATKASYLYVWWKYVWFEVWLPVNEEDLKHHWFWNKLFILSHQGTLSLSLLRVLDPWDDQRVHCWQWRGGCALGMVICDFYLPLMASQSWGLSEVFLSFLGHNKETGV